MTTAAQSYPPSSPRPGPALLTNLDPPETNLQSLDPLPPAGVYPGNGFSLDPLRPWSPAVVFRHTGWSRDRRRVYDALQRTAQSVQRRTDFADCGRYAYVYQCVDNPDEYRVGGSTCHDRFCMPCGRDRSRIIATNVIDKLQHDQARFLTLTLRSTTEPLAELLAKLTTDFAALRRSKLWRNKVTGGVAFLEVQWISATNRWHPHLHCLVQGRYLPKDDLAKTWLSITGTSHVIDIRLARDNNLVTHYITKYASKPLDHSVLLNPERLDEAILALKGKRLCLTFGTWRGYCLTTPLEDSQWIKLGTLDELLERATRGDSIAVTALTALQIAYAPSIRAPPSTSASAASSGPLIQTMFDFPAIQLRR